LATQILIYFIGKEEESTTDSAKEFTPHRLSRGGVGGYDLLEKKIIEEKLLRLREASGSYEVISPPSPPSRHEK